MISESAMAMTRKDETRDALAIKRTLAYGKMTCNQREERIEKGRVRGWFMYYLVLQYDGACSQEIPQTRPKAVQ